MMTKFYLCKRCGNVIVKLVDSGVTPFCCGQQMEELVPKTTDGAYEKHLPVVTRLDEHTIKVEVGSVPHPMMPEHHICFIYVETENGGHFHQLDPEKPAVSTFQCDSKPIAVYEFCNLHGLWKLEL